MTTAIAETPIRITQIRDLLAVLPYAIGYRPTECVLVVCVLPDGGLGLIARTALADLTRPNDRVQAADLVARRAREDGTEFAYVVVYSRAAATADNGAEPTAQSSAESTTAQAVSAAFALALETVAIPCERWCVGRATFRNLDCGNASCCPPDGYAIEELATSAVDTQLQLDGVIPAATREQAYRIPPASSPGRQQAQRASQLWAEVERRAQVAGPDEEHYWRRTSFALWRQAVTIVQLGGEPERKLLGRIAAALADPMVRDAILLDCLPGGEVVVERLLESPGGGEPEIYEVLGRLLDSTEAPPQDRAELEAAVTVLEAVVAHAQRRLRPAALTILALLAWWQGDGGRAGYRLTEVQRIDPNYRLGVLLTSLVADGTPPGWVRQRTAVGALV